MASNTQEGPLDKEFEKLAKETLEFWHVPGVSVAVVDGEHIYAQVSSFYSILPMLIIPPFRATAPHPYPISL